MYSEIGVNLKVHVILYFRLVYNPHNRTTQNSPGVDIRIPGFGGTETVEWLDHSQISLSK